MAKLMIKLISSIGGGGERGPAHARSAARRVRAGLPRLAGREDHPRRGSLRADLDRGPGGVGHGQHEARAERRAHDRHARRRERSRSATRSARRTSTSSACARSRSPICARSGGYDPRALLRVVAAHPPRARRVRRRASLAATSRGSSRRSSTACSTAAIAGSCSPTSSRTATTQARVSRDWLDAAGLGAPRGARTSRAWATSRATARFASTRPRSGT